jgi:hypothetical protein
MTSEAFIQLVREWQNFYFMLGGAAATLTGLLFVALTLGAQRMQNAGNVNLHAFVTPTYAYFVSVLVVAALMLVPGLSAAALSGGVGLLALILGSYALYVLWQLLHERKGTKPLDLQHWLTLFALPLLSALLLLGAAWLLPAGAAAALFLVAGGVAALLLISLRNAWYLMLWILYHS